MDQIPCPDGYLLDAKSPLADAHHALNQYLVEWDEQGWKPATKHLNAIRDKGLKLRIWTALLERLGWLRENKPDHPCFGHLHDLTYAIEEWKLAPTADDLAMLIRKTAEHAGHIMPYTPMPHLMAFVEEHGLTPDLSAAVRQFDAIVRNGQYRVNQVRQQLLNSRLDMLAWWDEWNDIDLKRCWSEQIRADYRSMQQPERENWRKLLHSIQGDEGVHPSKSWLAKAETTIQAIGAPDFLARLLRWFEPLRRGNTVKLSREGSFLLRALIWLVPSLNSPALMAIVSAIPEVEFKPKRNAEKVIRIAAEISGQEYNPPVPKSPPKPPPSLDAIMARALATVLSPQSSSYVSPKLAGRVSFEGELVNVRGDLDTYRMHVSTGAVFRESDGRQVHVAVDHFIPEHLKGLNIAGIGDLLGQLLILADDRNNAAAITVMADVPD